MNTEYLAITAIFASGLYVGFKIKDASYRFRNYVVRKGTSAKIKFF